MITVLTVLNINLTLLQYQGNSQSTSQGLLTLIITMHWSCMSQHSEVCNNEWSIIINNKSQLPTSADRESSDSNSGRHITHAMSICHKNGCLKPIVLFMVCIDFVLPHQPSAPTAWTFFLPRRFLMTWGFSTTMIGASQVNKNSCCPCSSIWVCIYEHFLLQFIYSIFWFRI